MKASHRRHQLRVVQEYADRFLDSVCMAGSTNDAGANWTRLPRCIGSPRERRITVPTIIRVCQRISLNGTDELRLGRITAVHLVLVAALVAYVHGSILLL